MIVTRRTTLGGLAAVGASLLLPRKGFAATPHRWTNGGFNPYVYRNEPDEGFARALAAIEADKRERDHFLNEFTARRLGEDHIRNGQIFDAMVFGRAEVYREVIATTSSWRPDAPRTAEAMFWNKDDGTVAWIKPHVCGNWSRSIWNRGQPRCIPPG